MLFQGYVWRAKFPVRQHDYYHFFQIASDRRGSRRQAVVRHGYRLRLDPGPTMALPGQPVNEHSPQRKDNQARFKRAFFTFFRR